MIFSHTFSAFEKLFHEKYILSSTIKHRGERGRQRENSLLLFLRENLPLAYGVATGEIIPFIGDEVSPQCDIIIYDQLRMPIIGKSQAVQQVPLESVYGVIECKSVLTKAFVNETHEKFEKIRKMPRCNSFESIEEETIPPFFMVFGYKLKTSVDNLISSMKYDDTTIISLDNGLNVWIEGRDKPVWIEATDMNKGEYQTLVLFYMLLLDTLKKIDLGEPNFMEMLIQDN